MRYLLPLFFASASASVFAMCPFGENVGRFPIGSPSTMCYQYSQSSLGGCVATCTGACVELPNANPPSVGPYTSTGAECKSGDGGGDGDGDGDGDGGVKPPPITYKIPDTWVGPTRESNFAPALTAMTASLNQTLVDLGSNLDMTGHVNYLGGQLERISGSSNRIENTISSLPFDLRVSKEHLSNIDVNIAKLVSGDADDAIFEDKLFKSLNSISGSISGNLSTTNEKLNQLNSVYSAINNLNQPTYQTAHFTKQISDTLDKINDKISSGSGEDKPCTGPLCSFNKPSGSSGSALSSVFGPESIEDVKAQVETKNGEIMQKMDEIKKVFVSEQISISGTYNNDYQDVHGVKVDLSGKSNMELFFNSGPKTAIWFIAVLIAFTILMGGRKNA